MMLYVPSLVTAAELRKLRTKLGESLGERANLFSPRFDRYVAAVLVHAGYRLEPVRAQLDAGLERLAEPLLATGALDEKSFDAMCTSMERTVESASTVMALVAQYRTLVSDIQNAIQSPTRSRRDRGIRHSLTFMREHAGEPLTRGQVARTAGFTSGTSLSIDGVSHLSGFKSRIYFHRVFKHAVGMTPIEFRKRGA